jgi:two-component system LytT family response regulator
MKVLIVDDEPLARLIVKEYLESYPEVKEVVECGDGFEGFKAVKEVQPDLIFLDIQMPKINGFEMLEMLDNPPKIIFTTAFDEYAIKAFESHAIDYLLKPFSKERFDKAIRKAINANSTSETKALINELRVQNSTINKIVVKTNNNIRIIPLQEIHYLEAYDDYVKIHTKDSCYLKKQTLTFYENSLPAQNFMRIHRSFLVNTDQITRIEPSEKDSFVILLKDGKRVPVSKSGYIKLKAALGL